MELANSFLFTSESVSEGHPDKVADLSLIHILTLPTNREV